MTDPVPALTYDLTEGHNLAPASIEWNDDLTTEQVANWMSGRVEFQNA